MKVGVDDFIVREGAPQLRALLGTATPVDGTVDEIYIDWLTRYLQLGAAAKVDLHSLAGEVLRKGYFDKTNGAARRRIAATIRHTFPELNAAIDECVHERLDKEFDGVPAPEHGGADLAVGRRVHVPGSQDSYRIDALQEGISWCSSPNAGHSSRPFPRHLVQLAQRAPAGAQNGLAGGRPRGPSATQITNAFLAQRGITVQNVCTLRHIRGQWYRWNGRFYEKIQEQDVRGMVMSFLRQHPLYSGNATTKTLTDVLNQLKAHDAAGALSTTTLPVWINDDGPLDATGWISMRNGLVNIEQIVRAMNGEDCPDSEIRREHTPRLLTVNGVDYDFDPGAKCPMFEQYLFDVQPDPKAREMIQMLLGLCLVRDVSFNVFFVLVGKGGEGKSVLLHIIVMLVGPYNVVHVPFSKFVDKFSVGLMSESLVNIIGEGDTELPRDVGLGRVEGVLKDVCDGGLLPVEHKYEEPGWARATARCVAASNCLPGFYDRSDAIWDRLRVVPFDVRIRGTDREDRALRDRIVKTELPGIFNFAIAGLAKLRGLRRFPETERGARMKAEHRARCDHEREFLLEHFVEREGSQPIATQDVYRAYRAWMSERNYRAQGEGNFAESVIRVFRSAEKGRPRDDSGKQFRAWIGLMRKEEVDADAISAVA